MPETLSEAEVGRLIMSAPDARLKALLATLAFSGIRNSELCRLKVGDLDAGNNRLKVVGGKNAKDRYVNIAPECIRLLLAYLSDKKRHPDERLFMTLQRNNPLTTQDVRKILTVAARRAGITRRIYPHLLRHSLATNLLNRGASLLAIREQLGHAFIESTMIYAHPNAARTRAEYEFYKPAYL